MLKITLYKNCILNKNYNEVFSLGHKLIDGEYDEYSVFERYLLSLSGSSNIIIAYAYYENTGQLVFEYDNIGQGLIYNYNYMKIEERNDANNTLRLVRYCFIDNIEIKNEFVYLSYSEDIWHSYIHGLKGIRRSFLSNSRYHDYENIDTEYMKIPVDYDGNDMLKILVDEERELTKCNIYAQIQLKQLDSKGNPTKNFESYIVRLKYIKVNSWSLTEITTPSHYWTFTFNNTNVQDYISAYEYAKALNHIALKQAEGRAIISSQKFDSPPTMPFNDMIWAYEIGKIWLVPYEWFVEDDLESSENLGFIAFDYKDDGNDLLIGKIVNYQRGEQKLFKSYSIDNDYTNLYCGTFKTHFEFNNNGTDLDLELSGYCDNYNFQIMLNAEGNILDITDDFEIDMPYTVYSAESTKQAQISRALKNENLNFKNIQDGIKLAKETNNAAQKFTGGVSSFGKSKSTLDMVAPIGKMAGAIVDQSLALVDFGFNISHNEKLKSLVNAKAYSTIKSVDVNNATVINGIYGLLIFRMTLDNKRYVKECIDNFGYLVYNFINANNDILELEDVENFQDNECNYNVVKFDTCNVFGSFTNEIANMINLIFINGVKIWYDETLTEDSYVEEHE